MQINDKVYCIIYNDIHECLIYEPPKDGTVKVKSNDGWLERCEVESVFLTKDEARHEIIARLRGEIKYLGELIFNLHLERLIVQGQIDRHKGEA